MTSKNNQSVNESVNENSIEFQEELAKHDLRAAVRVLKRCRGKEFVKEYLDTLKI